MTSDAAGKRLRTPVSIPSCKTPKFRLHLVSSPVHDHRPHALPQVARSTYTTNSRAVSFLCAALHVFTIYLVMPVHMPVQQLGLAGPPCFTVSHAAFFLWHFHVTRLATRFSSHHLDLHLMPRARRRPSVCAEDLSARAPGSQCCFAALLDHIAHFDCTSTP
jgi:hypothetical protein